MGPGRREMKKESIIVILLVAVMISIGVAIASLVDKAQASLGAAITYTTTYANPADTPVLGAMIDPSGYYSTDWGYDKTAGNALDNERVWIYDWGYPGDNPFMMLKWDMGSATNFLRVYPDCENGFQADGHDYLEWSLWGSNNPAESSGAWTLLWDPTAASSVMKTNDDLIVTAANGSATSAKIYRYGTNLDVGTVPGDAYSDAFTIDLSLPTSYRYFGIRASTMAINAGDPDPEINAVAGVPPTPTPPPPTPTPTPPATPSVGGVVDIQVDGSDWFLRPADEPGSSGRPYAAIAGAAAAAGVAMAAGAWYARRRWLG
jgi:hypothetical protein